MYCTFVKSVRARHARLQIYSVAKSTVINKFFLYIRVVFFFFFFCFFAADSPTLVVIVALFSLTQIVWLVTELLIDT